MDKPRIFLGSSGKQEKLLQALTRGLEDVAHVEPWTTSFNPGTTTLERLLELAHRGRLRRVRVRSGRLDDQQPARSGSRGLRPGLSARQRGLRSRSLRWRPRNAPNLHPPCEWREASQRSPRSHVRTVRRSDDRCGDEGRQSEASEGDRERGPRRPHRGPVVAVLLDGAQLQGAFGREPAADLARPRRRAGGERPLVARGRHPVRALLERSREGAEGSAGRLLLLERRTASGPERAAAGRDG